MISFDKDSSSNMREESHIKPSKHLMIASIYIPALTEEEIDLSKKQMYEEMKSYRERRERDLRGSVESAKKFYVKGE